MGEDESFELSFSFDKLKKSVYFHEIIYAFLFLIVLFSFLNSYGGNTFVHESPYQFLAGDMFWLTSESEGIKSTNDVLNRPFFLSAGRTDIYNAFPLGLPTATAEVSFFTGHETFDSLFHLNFFFIIMSMVFVYFLLRKISIPVAMFGTPLALLFLKWPFSYPVNFGAQMSTMNMFTVFGSAVAFLYLKERWMFIVLGLLNGIGFYAHGRESLMFNLIVVLFFGYQILKKQFDLDVFKKYCMSVGVTIISMWPILPIYLKTLDVHEIDFSFLQFCPASPASSHPIFFSHFGILQWLIFAGIGLSAVTAFTKKLDFEKSFVFLLGFGFLFNSYFCVLGNKTTQIRHFFPLTLALFFGYALYVLYSQIPESKSKGSLLLIIAGVVLVFVYLNYNPGSIAEYPVSNPYTWDAIQWSQNNIPYNNTLLFMYGDNHYQYTLFFLSKKIHSSIEQKDYYATIQSKKITPYFPVIDGSLGYLFVRTSFFDVRYDGILFMKNISLCDYDYVLYNKQSQNQLVQQYTNAVGSLLVTESGFTPAYQNDLVVILKNNGGACFAERTFA
ncbi:MAG TPA: hypothetical protein VKE88_00155 [Candidatus Nanoarchaeia archaeon]|nr:hypothetical protein [Candidatus Nanoarchaeia archaeon]